ncbi:LCP family protein required for cell wall assembly [Microbacterium resistens]|uniref:LCP family protein required for cell wall assembly n=1 Tax=Microbacterium resistens TaxID=156977 RepID=A0ABU1SAE8_9MICO|nr:LCP family protein [Microbacterium resistens]MDR6866577.1 LCP family protein required for cell wall assembly [Microbacterium resistens]
MSANSRTRRPVAGHGQLHRPSAWGQLLKIIGVAMAVVLVSGVGVAAYVAYDLQSTFVANSVELDGQESVPPDIGSLKGGVNMLLVGTDKCEPSYSQYFGLRCEEDDGGERNDVNMLLHISDAPRRVTVITFPRDLMLPIPECTDTNGNIASATSKSPLNTAFEKGGLNGLNCVVKTISQISGLEIPFAAKVTWGGVIEVTNAIGGVPVCIANGLTDEYTGLNFAPGTYNLAGWEALQFLRTRHGVGDGSDLGRVSNQQVYMASLARKVVSDEVLSNPATVLRLARTTIENVTPSASLTNPMLLAQIAMAVRTVPFEDINFLRYPVLTDPDDPNKVVPDETSADQLWAALLANQQLKTTGQDKEAVVNADGSTPAPPADTVPPADGVTPTTDPGVAVLPENIAGQSAADQTCSNGVGFNG